MRATGVTQSSEGIARLVALFRQVRYEIYEIEYIEYMEDLDSPAKWPPGWNPDILGVASASNRLRKEWDWVSPYENLADLRGRRELTYRVAIMARRRRARSGARKWRSASVSICRIRSRVR
jgi:hypothetical protein